MTKCSSCGHPNDEGAVFCANCHHFLAWSASQVAGGKAREQTEQETDQEEAAGRQPPPAEQSAQPPPVPSPPPLPKPVPPTGVANLISAIDDSKVLAADRGRPDLIERLANAKQRIETRTVTVAVVGEFKRGKSTLVNALIQTAACPVDADIVTAVPTLVRYGDKLAVTAYVQRPGDTEPTPTPVGFEALARLVSEAVDDQANNVRSVDVRVPHRILRGGLCLLDTPGVGGLDSVHGQVTLASLNGADALLFVTDASQELTAPELEFLQTAVGRCPTAALVVTKTDLYVHWREVVDLTRRHLAKAGLDLPVIPVSSFLRLRAARQPELNTESGFAPLVEFLAKDLVRSGSSRAAATIAHDVDFVASQLAHEADTERIVLARPEKSEAVINRLGQANERAGALTAPSSAWQQMLADGIQDLVSDVEHDLQARLRAVLREAREIIDEGDPRDSWTDTEVWLRRQVAMAGVANRDLLRLRAGELSDTVSQQFNLDAGVGVELEFDDVTRALSDLELPSASTFSMPGGRLGSLMMVARTSVFLPMMAFSFVPVIGWAIAGAAAATLGAAVGGKLFQDEGKRQRSYRQAQAKTAVARFIDEIAFEMNKATRDGLRRTQRRLRDEFASRATSIHASTGAALQAARRAAALGPEGQVARSAKVDADARRLVSIRSNMRELAARGADA